MILTMNSGEKSLQSDIVLRYPLRVTKETYFSITQELITINASGSVSFMGKTNICLFQTRQERNVESFCLVGGKRLKN